MRPHITLLVMWFLALTTHCAAAGTSGPHGIGHGTGSDLNHNIQVSAAMRQGVQTFNERFGLGPEHLIGVTAWPFLPHLDEPYLMHLHNFDTKYMQLGTRGDYTQFVTPWTPPFAPARAGNRHILFFEIGNSGQRPIGYAEYAPDQPTCRSTTFDQELRRATDIVYDDMKNSFRHFPP